MQSKFSSVVLNVIIYMSLYRNVIYLYICHMYICESFQKIAFGVYIPVSSRKSSIYNLEAEIVFIKESPLPTCCLMLCKIICHTEQIKSHNSYTGWTEETSKGRKPVMQYIIHGWPNQLQKLQVWEKGVLAFFFSFYIIYIIFIALFLFIYLL